MALRIMTTTRLLRGRSSCRVHAQFMRHLSSVPPRSFSEPAEAADDAAAETHREADLLSALYDPPQGKTKLYAMAGASAMLGLSGTAVLGYSHWSFLQPLLLDLAGTALLATGAGLAVAAAKSSGGNGSAGKHTGAKKGHEWAVEFVPLNDDARFASAVGAMPKKALAGGAGGAGGGAGGGSSTTGMGLSQAAEEALSKAEAAAEEVAKAERQAAKEAAMSRLQEQLAAGDEPRRLRQALSPRVFVIDFDTRPPARQGSGPPRPAPSNRALLDDLRETVSLLLHVATPFDEVVLRVTSPGGPVTDYGLAAAQFGRLKAAGVKTTACVDLVAASGGYMIACAADQILAAPFSIVGSIGVVAGVPNVHRLLERGGVEYVQRTAGNFKRTINIFTPNTEEGLKKFDEELQLVHTAFMAHVGEHRKERLTRSLEDVCTGETWLAINAQPLGLVDGLTTSDTYLRSRQREADVFLLRPAAERRPQGLLALLKQASEAAASAANSVAGALGPVRGWAEHQQQGPAALDFGAGAKYEHAAAAAAAAAAERGVHQLPLDAAMPPADTPLLRSAARA